MGSFRIISGWIGKVNGAGHRVITPTSTIGIRGTDHEPYVVSSQLAKLHASREGTYDKVNRGGTTMEVGQFRLDIDAGKVGFARSEPEASARALITILMPVLLEKVPGFYIPGRFDAELDQFSLAADQGGVASPPPAVGVAPLVTPMGNSGTLDSEQCGPDSSQRSAVCHFQSVSDKAECTPALIADAWLGQLDRAVARYDAVTIIGMFASDVVVRATVRDAAGQLTTLDLTREELIASTLAVIEGPEGLSTKADFRSKRMAAEVNAAETKISCDNIQVKSVVLEQGSRAGKPFRFESQENYVLVNRGGKWIATRAETAQR